MMVKSFAYVSLGTVHKGLEKKTERIGNQKKNGDNLDYRILFEQESYCKERALVTNWIFFC